MHKTETVDYGIVLAGERELILDDRELLMKPGDIVIQVGAWHRWRMPKGAMMAFDMIGARFVDGAAGLAQGRDAPMRTTPKLPAGVKPTRRIVTIDREPGKSSLVSDGPAPDVRTDPARPGYACARLWVTDSTPAKNAATASHPRAANSRLRLHGPHLPARRYMERQGGLRRGAGAFSGPGITRGIDLLSPRPASLHAEDAHARFLPRARRRNRSRARYTGSTLESPRYRRATRHQPRLGQSLDPARRHCDRLSRRAAVTDDSGWRTADGENRTNGSPRFSLLTTHHSRSQSEPMSCRRPNCGLRFS
jgi:hypothetical protein